METFAEAVTQYCLRKRLIDFHQTEWCRYMVMHRAMSIISLLWLVPVGTLFSRWYISLAFVFSYRFLRSRTGGYHAKTPFGCILSSTVLQILGMYLISHTILASCTVVLFVLSSIIIILQAPANNAELHLSVEEIQALKPRIKLRLLILLALTIIFSFTLTQVSVCISFGVATTAVLLLLSKIGVGAQQAYSKKGWTICL